VSEVDEQERLGFLPCCEIVELMTDYIEGLMEPSLRERFERHLSNCPPCREYLEQMRSVIALAGRPVAEDVPEPTLTALREAFRGWPDG
jgi:anti-sigma factor RsiW